MFGAAIAGVRRRRASVRDAIVRSEPWLQAGMPVLVAACVGVTLMPSSTAVDPSFVGKSDDASRGRQTAAVLGRNAGLHAAPPIGRAPVDRDDAFVERSRGRVDWPTMTKRRAAWRRRRWTGTPGARAGEAISTCTRSEGLHRETWTYTGTGIDCGGRSIIAAAVCATWNVVPEDRRHHEAGGDNDGAGAGLAD